MITPELLAPAGGFKALEAAIDAGADAVYFGGEAFGARAFAKNFDRDEIAQAAKLCRAYGVKSYITLNTLIYDREMEKVLEYAAFLENAGIDALIIADMGAASLIKKAIPTMRLHASTQASGHNLAAAQRLYSLGFERMVAARELSKEDLSVLCAKSPIEIETFIHGALCVSHSGQCLMSSMIGNRSGNRGMCAQPCRMPDANGNYPLSLKDLAMASRIPELLSCGAASLKIEGRMKSAEYVHGVVKIYRRLLDERRNASADELAQLEEIFSRDGFTTGYFDKNISSAMLGTRSDDARRRSRTLAEFEKIERRKPVCMSAKLLCGKPFEITVSGEKGTVTVYGAIPEEAVNAPLTKEALEKNLTKLGGTAYVLEKCEITLDEGLIIRVSEINALRREAISRYMSLDEREHTVLDTPKLPRLEKVGKDERTALVMRAKNLPEDGSFYEYFDTVFLPLAEFLKCKEPRVKGIALPAVIFESEKEKVAADIERAKQMGATDALVGNYGHLPLAKGLKIHGDFRLNVTNSAAASLALDAGFDSLILSPELSVPMVRDIGGSVRSIVYGRLPLMLLEKCVAKEVSSCKKCDRDAAKLCDRVGACFPILREEPHRSIVFNSVHTYMLDRKVESGQHFIFTDEDSSMMLKIVDFAKKRTLPDFDLDIRRMKTEC